VSDTDTSCPQHDCTIRAEILTTVWALGVAGSREATRCRQIGLAEELVSETSSSANNEGHAGLGLLKGEIVGGHGETLLVDVVRVLLFLAPRDGEGVVGPQTNGRHVEVCVLTGAETPGAGHLDGNAKSVARKDLNIGRRATITDIVDEKAGKTQETLSSPDGNDTVQHELLGALLQVNPDGAEGKRSTDDVAVQKDLVERVADWRGRLKEEEGECNGALFNVSIESPATFKQTYNESGHNELAAGDRCLDSTPALCNSVSTWSTIITSLLTGVNLVGDPADSVGDSLEDDNSSKPAVNKVHGVERDAGELDDGVVAASQEEERNHVHDRHDTRTAEELTSTGREAAVVDLPDAESDVDGKVADQKEALETAGECANANSRGHLELAVVTSAPERCVQARLLEAGIVVVGDRKVALGLVVKA